MATLCLLLGACASNERTYDLGVSQRAYTAAVRWSEFPQAAGYLHPEARPDPRRLDFLIERLNQVQVVGYRTLSALPGSDELEQVFLMELRVVNRHTAQERTIRDRQVWRYDEDSGRWWLHSGLPDITADAG